MVVFDRAASSTLKKEGRCVFIYCVLLSRFAVCFIDFEGIVKTLVCPSVLLILAGV